MQLSFIRSKKKKKKKKFASFNGISTPDGLPNVES